MTDPEELFAAVKQGDATRVRDLLGGDAALARAAGEHGKTGLHWAAELDREEAARALIDGGADLAARTEWGATPLEWAAWMGSARVAEMLLARGGGPLTLVSAAALGKLDDVRAIVATGGDLARHRRADAPVSPSDHWPADSAHIRGDVISDALQAAARNGHDVVVEYLLAHGADINAKGVFGGTGLHWAAINGHAATVDLLVERGADVTLRDARFDSTPAGWAEEGGHQEIAARLRQRGHAR